MSSSSEAVEKGQAGSLNVIYSEMNEVDRGFAIETCTTVMRNQEKLEHVTYYKDAARLIKEELDKSKGGMWNVIVGKSFGSFVTHETKTIIMFYLGNIGFLLWRHG
jgi:dynein light chain LC8-type